MNKVNRITTIEEIYCKINIFIILKKYFIYKYCLHIAYRIDINILMAIIITKMYSMNELVYYSLLLDNNIRYLYQKKPLKIIFYLFEYINIPDEEISKGYCICID